MTTLSIPATFKKDFYNYRLFKRNAKVAIYEQFWGDKLHAYEVHRIRKQKNNFSGETVGRLASDADWGVWARTYSASLYGGVGAKTRAEAQMYQWSGSVPANA